MFSMYLSPYVSCYTILEELKKYKSTLKTEVPKYLKDWEKMLEKINPYSVKPEKIWDVEKAIKMIYSFIKKSSVIKPGEITKLLKDSTLDTYFNDPEKCIEKYLEAGLFLKFTNIKSVEYYGSTFFGKYEPSKIYIDLICNFFTLLFNPKKNCAKQFLDCCNEYITIYNDFFQLKATYMEKFPYKNKCPRLVVIKEQIIDNKSFAVSIYYGTVLINFINKNPNNSPLLDKDSSGPIKKPKIKTMKETDLIPGHVYITSESSPKYFYMGKSKNNNFLYVKITENVERLFDIYETVEEINRAIAIDKFKRGSCLFVFDRLRHDNKDKTDDEIIKNNLFVFDEVNGHAKLLRFIKDLGELEFNKKKKDM